MIQNFYRGLIGAVLGLFLATPFLRAQTPEDADFPFRPDGERQAMAKTNSVSAYRQFLQAEGIPVYTGWGVDDLMTVKLGPWKREGPGITGAYLFLEGGGGVNDARVWEIPVRGQTAPEHHLFEEQILVLSGEGETLIWQKDANKRAVVPWKKGTVFSPPLNAWHVHVNKGSEPARMVAATEMPIKLDLFHDPDFIFNCPYDFTARYNGQADYFDPENSKDYAATTQHALSVVNVIRNAWTWRLFHAGQGVDDTDRHFNMVDNTMSSHIEQFPVGTYERGHRHGPGSTIILLSGTGYSLMWDQSIGETPWKDGKADKVIRVDWKAGTIFVPPNQWYHQHFNSGAEPARFIKLGGAPGNESHRLTTPQLRNDADSHMILYRDEDPFVRKFLEQEMAKHGAHVEMPPRDELIAIERDGGEKMLRSLRTYVKKTNN